VGCQEVGTDHCSGRSGSVGPCRHALSQPWRVPKLDPLAKPLLGKWLCVLKDARPCRIFQCRYLSNLVGANSHRRSLSLLSTPRENCCARKPLATVRVRAAHVREWLPCLPHPLGDYGAHVRPCKSASKLPPAEPFATGICAARHREWLRSGERSVPPTGQIFHCEFSCSQFSCSFSPTKRLTFSTIDPISCGFRRNASAPASRASSSFAVPDIIMIRRS
jgi:hypothetical protein